MKNEITYNDYEKVQICVGTILEAKPNEKARKPSYVMKIDFGDQIGIKTSSAQITNYYKTDDLIDKQIMAVCNFPPRNIAGVVSQVLILGSIDKEGKVVLVHPSQKVENGLSVA